MQVYIELSLLENFCMDFTLLYCARAVSRNRAKRWRMALAAAVGAVFAVIFPLVPLGAAWAAVIKIASGFLIALAACNFSSVKAYLKFSFAFVGFSFLLGGALIALFSLTGAEYAQNGAFTLSPVPIGIPMFGALLIVIFARYLAKRLKKKSTELVRCRIICGGAEEEIPAFFDSGNKVFYKGLPVCVIPYKTAEKLADVRRIKDSVKIHTVAGSSEIKVFTAEKVIIYSANSQKIFKNMIMGVSAAEISRAVLHPDFLEE